MLKDDGKGSVATYATEGSRQANIAVAVKKHKFLYSHKGIGKNGWNGQTSTREANERL